MAVTNAYIAGSEAASGTSALTLTATTVAGRKYFLHVVTEGAGISAVTADGSSIASGLVASWDNTGVSNPRTFVYLFTAADTSTDLSVTPASATKRAMVLIEAQDLLSVRASSVAGAVSGSASIGVSSAPGDTCVVFLSSWYQLGSITPGTGLTHISGTGAQSDLEAWAGNKAGATGTVTMDATFGSGQWSAVAISQQPATTVAAPTNGTITGTVAGDKITLSWPVTSAEAPSCQASLGGADTVGPTVAAVTGSAPNYTATVEFPGLANGTYTSSVTSGNSGGTDTDTGPSKAVELILLTPDSVPLLTGTRTVNLSASSLNMIKGETRRVVVTVLDEFSVPVSGVAPVVDPVVPGSVTVGTVGNTNGDGQVSIDITANISGTILVDITA